MLFHMKQQGHALREFRCEVELVHSVCTNYCEVSGLQNLIKPTVRLLFSKMLKSLAGTFFFKKWMDKHRVNLILPSLLPTPSPITRTRT